MRRIALGRRAANRHYFQTAGTSIKQRHLPPIRRWILILRQPSPVPTVCKATSSLEGPIAESSRKFTIQMVENGKGMRINGELYIRE